MRIRKENSLSAWSVIAVLCCMMNALSAATSGLFNYTDNGISITITRYPRAALGAVEIPSTIIGKPVTSIESYAFDSCAGLTSITIPASVTSIVSDAFYRCTGLTAITVNTHNAIYSSLDGVLFDKNQTKLILCPGGKAGNVMIPASVTSIEDGAFYHCSGLTAITVDLHNASYGSLDGLLLNKNQTRLILCPGGRTGSITIPASVTSIENYAFDSCTGLTSITIPASVTSIVGDAFYHCTGLRAITVDTLNANYSSLDGMLYDKNQTKLIQCPCGKADSITIPVNVTSIGSSAFYHCTSLPEIIVDSHNVNYNSLDGMLCNKNLTTLIQCPGGKPGSVTIPFNVTRIGSSAFSSCTKMTSVNIPASVASIGSLAFSFCTGLSNITIPASVTSIGSAAFSSCTGLTAINVDVENTNYSSLDGILFNKMQTTLIQCPGGMAGSVTIPPNVTSIESGAFSNCIGLASVTIPSSLTSIVSGAFSHCTSLTSVTIPMGVIRIGSEAFSHCTGLASVIIPDSVTSMGDGAFSHCTGLSSVTIPAGITNIGSYAFDSCIGLTSVTIPSSVTSIERWAFYRCTGLTSITIPAGVTTIGDGAFSHCSDLTSAYFFGNAPSMGAGVFEAATSGFTLFYFSGKTGFTSPTWNGYKAEAKATPP